MLPSCFQGQGAVENLFGRTEGFVSGPLQLPPLSVTALRQTKYTGFGRAQENATTLQ